MRWRSVKFRIESEGESYDFAARALGGITLVRFEDEDGDTFSQVFLSRGKKSIGRIYASDYQVREMADSILSGQDWTSVRRRADLQPETQAFLDGLVHHPAFLPGNSQRLVRAPD